MNRRFRQSRSIRIALGIALCTLLFVAGVLAATSLPNFPDTTASRVFAQDTGSFYLPLLTAGTATSGESSQRVPASSQTMADQSRSEDELSTVMYFLHTHPADEEIPNCVQLLPQFKIDVPGVPAAGEASVQSGTTEYQAIVEIALVMVISDAASGNKALCGLTAAQRPLLPAIANSSPVQNGLVNVHVLAFIDSADGPTIACVDAGDFLMPIEDVFNIEGRSASIIAILGEEILFGDRADPEPGTVHITVAYHTMTWTAEGESRNESNELTLGTLSLSEELLRTATIDCDGLASGLNAFIADLFEGDPDHEFCAIRADGLREEDGRQTTRIVPSQWKVITIAECSAEDAPTPEWQISLYDGT